MPDCGHHDLGVLGCAMIYSFGCMVFILNDSILQAKGLEYDIVYRHERAHCNGWRHEDWTAERQTKESDHD